MRRVRWVRWLTPLLLAPALMTSPPITTSASPGGLETTKLSLKGTHHFSSLRAAAAAAPAATSGGVDAAPISLKGVVNRALSLTTHRGVNGGLGRFAVPAAAQPPILLPPHVVPSAITGGGAVRSFTGLNDYQQRYVANNGNQFTITPPDQALCVGNDFVLESVNDVLRIFNKQGVPLTRPIALNEFYGYSPEINRSGVPNAPRYGPEPTDPTCYYDPEYRRWFHVVVTIEVDPVTGQILGPNHIDIAVSENADPRDDWVFYHIPVQNDGSAGTPVHTDCPCLGDFPHIGFDKYGMYITTNEYPWNGTTTGRYGNDYNGSNIYALSKKQLAHNDPVVTGEVLYGMELSGGVPSFSLAPSEVPGQAYDTRHNGTEWFTQTSATLETLNAQGMNDKLGVWRVINTKSLDAAPALVLESKTLNSEVYGVPPQSEQKVGPVPLRDCILVNCKPGLIPGPSKMEVESPLDSSDSRVLGPSWLAGGTIFTANDTVVNVNGRFQAGVGYFLVSAESAMSDVEIQNQGYKAVAGNITYPSIATLGNKQGAMAISLVGADFFPSAAFMAVGPNGPTGPVHVAAAGVGPDDEFCGYYAYNCGNSTGAPTIRPRWGDYGAAAVDENEVWIASEWIGQSCTFDQWNADPTCGHTRAAIGNWYTRITRAR